LEEENNTAKGKQTTSGLSTATTSYSGSSLRAVDLHNILFSLQSCGPGALWRSEYHSHHAILGGMPMPRIEESDRQCLPLLTLQALDGGKIFCSILLSVCFQLRITPWFYLILHL
jgi:hypothetical protein